MEVIDNFRGEFAFLSNFFVEKDGHTVEHKFQACKTEDQEWQVKIWRANSPAEAKKLGRKAPLRKNWDQIKVFVMGDFLKQKFSDPDLKAKLLATGDALLVEGNSWHDQFWGDCYCNTNPGRFGSRETCKQEGQNVLGRLLMKIRNELK